MKLDTRRSLATILLRALLGAALLSAAQGAEAADAAPDVLALSVQGPTQALVGSTVSVNTIVINLGGAFSGDYAFDVLLSTDTTVDAGDIVTASVSSAVLGSLTVACAIPSDLTPGTYNWAMRIDPLAGETETHNNSILGGQVEVFVIDLQVSGASAVNAAALVGGDNPDSLALDVANAGSADGILIFTVTEYPEASWLAVNPSTSFAVAGGSAQRVTLSFDITGLAAGEYATQLIFLNFQDATDYTVLPVTLTIGEVTFLPGDELLGEIDSLGKTSEALFSAVEGMKLRIKVSSDTGNLKPVVSILDEDGALVRSWEFRHSEKKVKKTVKLPATGVYRLRVAGADDSIGSYRISTKAILPSRAKSFTEKVKPDSGTNTAAVTLLSLAGALLDVKVTPAEKFSGAEVDLAVAAPGGSALDISGHEIRLDNGGVSATGLTLNAAGEYVLNIAGFGGDDEKVKVKVELEQELGDTTVLLP